LNPKHPRDYLWYLASPYSKYPEGLEIAHRQACRAAGILMMQNIRVFCPIAHTHHISLITVGMSSTDHDLWTYLDKPFVDMCDGLIVLKLITWGDSHGVAHEIQCFTEAHKPIFYMEQGEVPWTLQNFVKA
jgi:hypothetical protein